MFKRILEIDNSSAMAVESASCDSTTSSGTPRFTLETNLTSAHVVQVSPVKMRLPGTDSVVCALVGSLMQFADKQSVAGRRSIVQSWKIASRRQTEQGVRLHQLRLLFQQVRHIQRFARLLLLMATSQRSLKR